MARLEAAPRPNGAPVRVLLVDDSGVSRALMARWIDESGEAVVAAVAGSGGEAVIALQRTAIDVVVLDVEMPGLDGLATLPLILSTRPGVRVLMASALTERGARVTLEALRLGACDAIAKPRAGWATRGGTSFPEELVRRIVALGGPRAELHGVSAPARASTLTYERSGGHAFPPRAVVIGASTGGPNALFELVAALPADLPVPIFVAQHLPALFTTVLARQLDERAKLAVTEARQGLPVRPGTIYLAPGGKDMTVRGDGRTIALWPSADMSIGCPSVDALMESAVAAWGAQVLGIVLSGMGQDGLAGARAIVEAGGSVIAQDQASAMIWGMPGAVARAGLAAEVLPVSAIGAEIARLTMPLLAESR